MAKWRGSTPIDGPSGDGPGRSPLEAAAQAAREAEVRAVVDAHALAMRARDVEGLMALCAPDVVAFDRVPPHEHAGVDALRRARAASLAELTPPVRYEPRDVAVVVGGDAAFVRFVTEHVVAGARARLRTTLGLRRDAGRWRIAHEHVSASGARA